MPKIIFTKEQEDYICKSYLEGKTIADLQKELKYCHQTIKKVLDKNDIKILQGLRKRQFSLEEQDLIITMASNHESQKNIAKAINVDVSLIKRFIEEKNIHLDYRKKNKELIENYFEEINTEEKAYFLGLIYTDGNVRKIKDSGQIRLQLQLRDEEIIQKFKNEINSDCNLIYDRRIGKECVGIEITNNKLFNDLYNLGVIPNKTYLSNSLPKVPQEFLIPFLRGLFDGDGSLSYKENYNEVHVSFINYNYEIVEEFQLIIDNLINKKEHNKIIHNINDFGSSYRCQWRGRRQVLKILDLLYNNSNIYLKRKFDKYQRLLSTLADKDIV